ncbi:hypothetical protein CC1G_00293 [Coprinopsis cinerea okayama7|uniref:C2H2-type domain-containing protein n=1 Tax=Coprinopsis cinerea (strain Okayama-7 / 130 / ATCC MYA-4618 / FGSC 9003) TaxID=240176 RepID=A8NXG0_COPC7|nr:hypothetical protein CC1G_00293 [Coprinopsis cinerea okayama7\|eukprot:XP_001837157.2 hypothetical protein CC1G_00293 [Coprinopsis cinerea okayama7\
MPTSSPVHSPSQSNGQRSLSRESDDISTRPSLSRASSPSDHDGLMSDVESSKPLLPSLRDFCSGRLPSNGGSALDARIRDLGLEQPLPGPPPAPRAVSSGHYSPSPPISHRSSSTRTRDDEPEWRMMVDASAPSPDSAPSSAHCSPYQNERELPRFIERPPQPHPGHEHSPRRRSSSIESDSDDSYASVHRDPYPRTCLLLNRRHNAPPVYYRSHSFGTDESRYDRQSLGLRPAFPQPSTSTVSYRDTSQPDPYRPNNNGNNNNPPSPNWEDHVEKAGRVNGTGPVMFTCRWKKDNDQFCNYTGKKQLAKRHVESVHLAKKPHVCPTCQKPFPQKTSLDIHIRSVHTFEKSIKCDHCDACFSDPARRHKHIGVAHPDKVVKKARRKIAFDEIQHLLVKT